MIIKNQKGSFLLYIFFIVFLFLTIALGLSILLFGQIKMMGEVGYSVVALCAADAGIEEVLFNRQNPQGDLGELDNGATYTVVVIEKGENNCAADNYCIKSIGTYKETSRAIEIEY